MLILPTTYIIKHELTGDDKLIQMTTETLALVVSVINSLALIYLKYDRDKKLKKSEVILADVKELNNKMLDMLVRAELKIKADAYFDEKLITRLLMNGSRLANYDESILSDTYVLLNQWSTALSLKERESISAGDLSKNQTEVLEVIKELRIKIHKVFNSV